MPDTTADGLYRLSTVKGDIATIPEQPGLAVFRTGHIGVYIGNGYVIEAKGTKYGVVKSKLSERNFTHWCQIPGISYEKPVATPQKPLAYTVKSGDTMYEIAMEHGLTLSEIAKLNPQIKNLDLIHVGDTVYVSGKSAAKIKVGDKVTVCGVGNSQANGGGNASKVFSNKKMVVVGIREGAKYPYACSTVLTTVGLGSTTAWFSSSSIS
ncbi:MAG: LysM peptidoglycan-binding domain-containing protein [Clostridia bacterium]|nr:LysM peptidoglycan-binding domain-containing protein [Clostridia bacterium]